MVDLSNVVMRQGRGFVLGQSRRCGLCGLRGALKARCVEPTCRGYGEKKHPFHFHATCARQAGLEVADDPTLNPIFYGASHAFQCDCPILSRVSYPCCPFCVVLIQSNATDMEGMHTTFELD